MKNFYSKTILSIFALLAFSTMGLAQTTAFNYQGRLNDGGNAANGNYDMQFRLFDMQGAGQGTQQGATVSVSPVAVSSGNFKVELDFGATVFATGADRFLEISIRPAGNPGGYTSLAPRQKLMSSPFSVRTLSAATADDALNLGGVAASEYVTTTNGGTNFIQNTTSPQAASNFNISGNGRIGGFLEVAGRDPLGSSINVTSGHIRVNRSGLGGIGINRQPIASLDIDGGLLWTSAGWTGGIGLSNASAIGWQRNASGQLAGIGRSGGGIYFFRTISSIGNIANPAIYDLVITDAGNVGVGTIDPQTLLHVNGRARIGSIPLQASGASVCFNPAGDLLQCGASSLKWKTHVRPFDLGLETVLRLRPIHFKWKESGFSDFGLGAEDVARVAPELTFFNDKGEVEGVKYDRLNVVFVNAFKEQQTQIEAQQKLIDAQQKQINELKKIVCSLKPDAEACKEEK